MTNNIDTFGENIGVRINCEKIGPDQHCPILIMQQNVDYVEEVIIP